MNFFQYSNDSRHQQSNALSQSSQQYRTSYLEETPKQQNSKDERIRNIKSKLQSIPSQQNKNDDALSIFHLQSQPQPSQSYISQNQNINNINLLSNSLYTNKPNQNSFLQQTTSQKSYLGTQVNMERKTRTQLRGSVRNENEDDQSLTNIREKNALFFDEDENRRRSFTPSQSSSNESFYKHQQQNQQNQKGGGFFGNKLQEIKLRRFQIDAAKLIIDRLVKISYKPFHDIYEYSLQQTSSSNRSSSHNQNIKNAKNQQQDPFQNIFENNNNNKNAEKQDFRMKLTNNKNNQLSSSSSSSTLMRRFEQDICLSDRKQRQNFQNNNFNLQTQPSDSSFSKVKSKLNNYQSSSQLDTHKINNRKLSIQLTSSTTPKPLYRHISPCERQQYSTQIGRSRNISSIITNNSLHNNSVNSSTNNNFNFSTSQNSNFNHSTNSQYNNPHNYSNSSQQQHLNHLQYFQQLSNGGTDLCEGDLRRASSQENKLIFNDNSFDNGFNRQRSTDKAQFMNNNQNNSLERNSTSYSVMMQQVRQNSNKTNNQQQQQQQNQLNSSEGNSHLNFYHMQQYSNNQQSNLTERISRNNNSSEHQTLKPSPQRKSVGGYIQSNNISVPKSFLDPHQKRLQRQSYSSQHLNSYFQTSFFKQNEEPLNNQQYQQHNIHSLQINDKPLENCLSEQSFIRMSTSGSRSGNNGGDLLSVRLNTNESNNNNNYHNIPNNRGSLRENDLINDQQLSRSYQKNASNQLRQEIENRRSFNNQKQDSLDAIFDDNIQKKGGSLIEYDEENDMKVSNIQKLKQEFNEIIKFSFQNEIKQPSFKSDEQQKINISNRASERVNTSNDNNESHSHNIYNQTGQNLNNSNSNLQQQQQKASGVQQNQQKQKIQDSFQMQLQKQQQQVLSQRGQPDERNCISARNNTSAFMVENLLNQEEVKSFSCYDEDLIKQQDLTIHQLSTKNQNLNTEFSNFKDELIFDKTVHSFDFNMSLRESENNLRQKINFQQDQSLSPNQIEKQIQGQQQISSKKPKNDQHIQIVNEQPDQSSQQTSLFSAYKPQHQQVKRENVQFNGSFGRLSVDSTPRNNDDTQLDQSKRPLSHFARQQSEEDNNQNVVIFTENNEEVEGLQDDKVKKSVNSKDKQNTLEANFSTKFSQHQQEQEGEGEEGDNESSRFSFELKNTLDEFQTQQHLEQIMFNQNNQTNNEDISIIEKNNKSNFSIFIDKNDRNNMSIFNSNNEELQNIVTNSQINFNSQHSNNFNTQQDNILIAQTFPITISNNINKDEQFNEISFDQNQHYHHFGENAKKQHDENTKKYYGEDTNKYFGETKKQLFMDNHLTVSTDGNEETSNTNLNAIHTIITGNSNPNDANLSQQQQMYQNNQKGNKSQQSNEIKSMQIIDAQQSLFMPHVSEVDSDQQIFQENCDSDEIIQFQPNPNEFTPPRRKMISPVNHYPMAAHDSSPIIDSDIVEGGQGLKIYEFSLKLQGIMRGIKMKNLRESFISIVIYSQLKSYLMNTYQSQWLQQQQNELLQAQRVAQIQNIPYYYQSQFSTIFEQQNETCSDIHQPLSMNASKLLDSRSLYDSKNLDQFNLEMNKFVQNQLQIASQHVTQSSIIESNISNSQISIAQPSGIPQGATQSEVVTEIDSDDNGIKQFWALSIISSKLKQKVQDVINVWRQNSYQKQLVLSYKLNQFVQKIYCIQKKKTKQAFNVIKRLSDRNSAQNITIRCFKLYQVLIKQQQKYMKDIFHRLINQGNRQEGSTIKKIDPQQLRYYLHSVIQIISNCQQKNVKWGLKQLKNQTIHKSKIFQVLDRQVRQKSYSEFLQKIKSIYELKRSREYALQPVLQITRRHHNQLFSKYLERWRMQLYNQSVHFNKYSTLLNFSNVFKSKSCTNIQIAFKKIQLKSLQDINKQKFLKNILLQILLFAENRKQELKHSGFQKLFSIYQFKKQREATLQNLFKSRLLKEQHKYFHLFCKRVNENKNHEQFIKTGIKSLLLMGSILQMKVNQRLLSAFKSIQFFNQSKRRISSASNPTIDLLNNEHETIKLTLKSLRNNLQKVKIESLFKGFSHIQQKFQYNQIKSAFRKIQENSKQKQRIISGFNSLEQIYERKLSLNAKLCYEKLKSLIHERLQLKKNIKSQKQIFCIFLKTLISKKIQNMKSTALQSIKERSHLILKAKRDKKLIYTESSMFAVKCKLLFGTLDKVFKKHLYQYPFQLIYGCQSQKYSAAMQLYQTLTNPNQKNITQNQMKKPKTQAQPIQKQTQQNHHASNLLHLSKSKSPLKKIQEQHQAKCEIIKSLVNKNDDIKSTPQPNTHVKAVANSKNKMNQVNNKNYQQFNQNDFEKSKPKTSQSQIIPPQQRQSPNQSANINQYKSQIITPSSTNNTNQSQTDIKREELSLSSKSKCITFGGNSNSPQQKNEVNNKSNTSIHNISNVSNFYSNSSPKNSERNIASQPTITSPQNSQFSHVMEGQKQHQQIVFNNTNQKLPYFQHNRHFSSGSVPSSFSQPLINSSSSMIFYNPSQNSMNQFN